MTYQELHTLYKLPLFDLIEQSRAVHKANWEKQEVQLCTLLSIKTGGCSEDCSYCAQSARDIHSESFTSITSSNLFEDFWKAR